MKQNDKVNILFLPSGGYNKTNNISFLSTKNFTKGRILEQILKY